MASAASSIGAKAEWVRPGRTDTFVLRSIGADDGVFPAEASRYHLYAPFNCPWSHRTTLTRAVLGLEDVVSLDVPYPSRTEDDHPDGKNRWQFAPQGLTVKNGRHIVFSECTPETAFGGVSTVHGVYTLHGVEQNSCPLLVDKRAGALAAAGGPGTNAETGSALVNNESADIMRMFATALRPLGTRPHIDLYPEPLRARIDELNAWIYVDVCNGAYKAGFTGLQDAYERAYVAYFRGFERVNAILAGSRFLCGDALTEADLRLFPTVFRHDPVYYVRFKLSHSLVRGYRHLWRWLCDVYAVPGVAEASPLAHMMQGYFGRTEAGLVPLGPPGYPELYTRPDAFFAEPAPPIGDLP